jgi:fermentation-respiration switch protein FrsA (DUF1100 family)
MRSMHTPRAAFSLLTPLLLIAASCLLGACGYVREPALGPSTTFATSPSPRWPVNFTPVPAMRVEVDEPAEPSKQTLARTIIEGVPAGQGWISSRSNQHEGSSLGETPHAFRYCAWKSRPAAIDADPSRPAFERLLELEASAAFRMGFRLWTPTTGEPRGLIIHQWGLGGAAYEQDLVDAMVKDGWAVLAYNGLSWRASGAMVLAGETPDAVGGTDRTTRATRDAESTEPLDATVNAAASLAASEYDEAIGQYVLAHEAALAYVRAKFPTIPTSPLVVVGCSFGSLMTPALVTRLGPQVSACVLVGSGAGILRVSGSDWQDAFYSRVRCGKADRYALPASQRERMHAMYLERATLDPYSTAASLRSIPTLMLHAKWDMIVPARCGDLLWEQAGRPERWSGSFGHLFMFMRLHTMANDLVQWIDQHARSER